MANWAPLRNLLASKQVYTSFAPLVISAASLFCIPIRLGTDETPPKLPTWEHSKLGNNVIYDGYTPFEDAEACEICQRISLDRILTKHGFCHCVSYAELETSVKYGCKLCTIILLAIEREASSFVASLADFRSETSCNLTLRLRALTSGEGENTDLVEIRLVTTIPRLNIASVDDKIATVGLYTDGETTAANFLVGRRIPLQYNTPQTIKVLGKWIMRTLKDIYPTHAPLPKRILDVGDKRDSRVKLLETNENILSRYICLSHCWGRQRHFQLTNETIQELRAGVRKSRLAKNFQDAILMARFLEIRYLWIDALCILQDSVSDWEQESARMGHYYKYSWLTIAAGMSDEGESGFLGRRMNHGLPYIRLKTQAKEPKEGAGKSKRDCAEHVEDSLYFALDPIEPSTQCPLRTRAWAFQEEILPERYLSFETTQAYFRCGTILHYECGRRQNLLLEDSPFIEGRRLINGRNWPELVMRYSSRNLTKESDKLPALSGLAHEYQVLWGDHYLAGLWRKELWKGLLWRRDPKYTMPEPKRPKEYRAPTWSWASMDGRIWFPADVLGRSKVRIKCTRTILSGTDPMGQVSSGSIELKAILIRMDRYGNLTGHLEVRLSKTYDVPGEVTPETHPRDQWFLWVTKTSGIIIRQPLENGPAQSIFERVGYFEAQRDRKLSGFWRTVRWKSSLSSYISPSRITLI